MSGSYLLGPDESVLRSSTQMKSPALGAGLIKTAPEGVRRGCGAEG
jgi:hypothetical protein